MKNFTKFLTSIAVLFALNTFADIDTATTPLPPIELEDQTVMTEDGQTVNIENDEESDSIVFQAENLLEEKSLEEFPFNTKFYSASQVKAYMASKTGDLEAKLAEATAAVNTLSNLVVELRTQLALFENIDAKIAIAVTEYFEGEDSSNTTEPENEGDEPMGAVRSAPMGADAGGSFEDYAAKAVAAKTAAEAAAGKLNNVSLVLETDDIMVDGDKIGTVVTGVEVETEITE